jgi:hypothetical protein
MQDRKSVSKPEWREKWKQLLERKTERTEKIKKEHNGKKAKINLNYYKYESQA